MTLGTRRLAPSLSLLLGGACLDAGIALEADFEDGLVVLVEVREGQPRRWQEVRRDSAPWVSDPGAELYVVHLSRRALELVHPGVDVERLGLSSIDRSSTDLAECAPLRFDRSTQGDLLEVGLRGVADVYLRSGTRLEPITEWPGSLDALSLRLPVPACRTRAMRIQPFLAAEGPLLRRGDRLGSRQVDENLVSRTRIEFVTHVHEDLVVVGLSTALLLVRRGGGSQGAPILEFQASSEVWGGAPEPGVGLSLLKARQIPRPTEGGGVQLVLLLGEHRSGTERPEGVRLVEVEAHAEGFGVPRLVHRAEHPHDGLATVSVDAEGRFAAGGQGWLEVGRLDGSVVPMGRTDVRAYEILISSEAEPELIVGERPLAWLQGDPANLASLERVHSPVPPLQNTSYVSVVRHVGEREASRLYSGTSESSLFEWADSGWKKLPIWYPEDLPGCIGAAEQCGRLWPRNVTGVRDLRFRPSGEMVFVLRDCRGVFFVDPNRLGCVDHLWAPIDDFTNNGGEDATFKHLSIWQDRAVIVGDHGLLFELVFD